MFAMGGETASNRERTLWTDIDDQWTRLPTRLLDAVADGELDAHLVAIADAVQARRQLLHTVNSATALAQLRVGEAVVFNHRIRPRYLEHEVATVTGIDDRYVTVRLSRPVGRFREGELRCPPLALTRPDPVSGLSAA
jgi:hypothetical protein